MRGLRSAYPLAENLLRGAQQTPDRSALVYSHHALGGTEFYAGNFVAAREHLECSISPYDTDRHRPLSAQYALDAGVICFEIRGRHSMVFRLSGSGSPRDESRGRVSSIAIRSL
jgi:hypothetical protein